MAKLDFVGSCVVLSAALASAAAGCGGNNSSSGGGGGGGGAGVHDSCAPGVDVTGCTTIVAPSADDATRLQTALIEVKSGGTVCLCPGTYNVKKQLSLTVPSVTVKGTGKNIDDTVLDFAASSTASGNDTMLVTADGFTIENMAVKNTPGNGVVVRQADKPTFRKLHVSWDGGPKATNGAYSVYPVESTNVLIEDCVVEGAADAAIYVGQCTGAVVRRNKAHSSVLGIELENTSDGYVYDNEAYDNTGGLAVFLLGNLNKKTSNKNLVYNNNIHDNNRMNFGDSQSFVASVPAGTGVIVVGADDVEIRDNTITNNNSGGVLVVNYLLLQMLVPGAKPDPMTDPNPERVLVRNNTFMGNGMMPKDAAALIGVVPLEDVLWDGIVPSGMPATNELKFCLGAMGPYPSFRMFAADHLNDKTKQSIDTTPYQCDLPAIPQMP